MGFGGEANEVTALILGEGLKEKDEVFRGFRDVEDAKMEGLKGVEIESDAMAMGAEMSSER